MFLFTKENMDADKPAPVINISPMRYIDVPKNMGITGSIQVSCYPQTLVAVITTVVVPVGEDLADIGIKARKVVIHTECDGEAYWVSSLG